jgi:hypothetical protein
MGKMAKASPATSMPVTMVSKLYWKTVKLENQIRLSCALSAGVEKDDSYGDVIYRKRGMQHS